MWNQKNVPGVFNDNTSMSVKHFQYVGIFIHAPTALALVSILVTLLDLKLSHTGPYV